MKKILLFFCMLGACIYGFSQRTITGRVTDEKGLPVVSASVVVKGTTTGTVTANDGSFRLGVPANAKTLIVSYVGMADKEIDLTRSNSYNVTLSAGTQTDMQDVVVVAYGTQTKRKLTSSVSTVGGQDFEDKTYTSLDQTLQGKVPGLLSVSPNGQPGASQQVRIRGIGSLNAGQAPLWVVDGIQVNSGDFSRLSTTSNALAGINPEDIESVSVLKDAAATAIYGSLGSNGVILITTKKGKAGKSKIRLDGQFGQSNLAYFNDLAKPANRDQYFTILMEGLRNAGLSQANVDLVLNTYGYNNTYNTDWVNLVTRTGMNTNINGSVSGGDQKTTFFLSGGYVDDKGVVIGSDFKRYSGKFSVRHKANEKLSVGLDATGSYISQNTPTSSSFFRNPIFAAYSLRPSQNAYNADGSLNFSAATFNQLFNPLAIVQYDKQHLNNMHFIGNVNGEYQIIKNLSFSTRFGEDFFDIEEENYNNPFFGDAQPVGGRIYNYNTRVSKWTWTNILDFKQKFLKSNDIDLDLKVGYEATKTKQFNISAQGTSVPLTTLIPLPTPASPQTASGARTDNDYASGFSLVQLNYQNKYSISGSFRRDGSSRFAINNKYGNFWSVGGAWSIDQEKFMSNLTVINVLKIRGSYGKVGNAFFTDYGWRGTYAFGATYNQQPGSSPSVVQNSDLTWESSYPLDFGLDVALLHNRISITADYYNKQTKDMLVQVPLAPTAGTSSGFVNANFGQMENKGWEFQLNATPLKLKDLTWEVNFNITMNKNKLVSIPSNNTVTGINILRIGEDVQSIRTRFWAGVDPANGDPLWYTDSTKTKTTNNVNQAGIGIIGSAAPKGFGGFGTTLTYKGFSLSAQFNYQYGNLVYDDWGFLTWNDGFYPQFNIIQKELDRWQKPGDITDVPKVVYGGSKNSNAESSRWYYKGDFIRLRDVTLSYTLPKSVLTKIKMDNARFFVQGTNLWTKAFDKRITFDPEQQINGTADLTIMQARTLTVGLSLGF